MVGTINPVVHRDDSRGSWRLTVLAFGLAGAATAGATGAAISLLGTPLRDVISYPVRLGIVVTLSLVYALHEVSIIRVFAPQRRRQVTAAWRTRYRPWVGGALFGAFLGPGLFTYVFTASYYVLLAVVALLLAPVEATIVMAIYGGARALPLYVAGRSLTTADEAFERGKGLVSTRPVVYRANAVVMAGMGIFMALLLMR